MRMALHTANVTVTPVSPYPSPPQTHFCFCLWKTCVQAKFGWVADETSFDNKKASTVQLHESFQPALYVHLKNKSEKPNSPGWSLSTLGTVLDRAVSHWPYSSNPGGKGTLLPHAWGMPPKLPPSFSLLASRTQQLASCGPVFAENVCRLHIMPLLVIISTQAASLALRSGEQKPQECGTGWEGSER